MRKSKRVREEKRERERKGREGDERLTSFQAFSSIFFVLRYEPVMSSSGLFRLVRVAVMGKRNGEVGNEVSSKKRDASDLRKARRESRRAGDGKERGMLTR